MHDRQYGPQPAPTSAPPVTAPAPTAPHQTSVAGMLALQRSAGNAAVVRMLDEGGGRSPIRRDLYDGTLAEPVAINDAAKVDATPELQGLSAEQRARIIALATDAEEFLTITEALERTRNTVVGAVDGSRGMPERDFVINAWRQRANVKVYDPEMATILPRLVNDAMVAEGANPATAELVRGSITQFGVRVPHTDVLVPHPGPWIGLGGGADLATCLEQVMGSNSAAYVLTDNEPGSAYAATLVARIGVINAANAAVAGYVPLVATTTTITAGTNGAGKPATELAGAALIIGHLGDYRLVTVRRA